MKTYSLKRNSLDYNPMQAHTCRVIGYMAVGVLAVMTILFIHILATL